MQVECVVCGKKFSTDYKNCVACSAECKKNYSRMYVFTISRTKHDVRNSGKKYANSKEKLLAIKEKYKNGISKEMIENWLEIKQR